MSEGRERFQKLNEQAKTLAEEAKTLKAQFKDFDRRVQEGTLLWEPSKELLGSARIVDYQRWLERERGLKFAGLSPEKFWETLDQVGGIIPAAVVLEPLSPALAPAPLHALTRGSRVPVKQFLMDARRIVGVGNIYASESLFRAGIDPRRRANRVSLKDCIHLAKAIKQTLRAAIRAGGSSLRDYVGADGALGDFQSRTWVYAREGEPCRRCRTAIRRIVQAGRSSFYCPTCQR